MDLDPKTVLLVHDNEHDIVHAIARNGRTTRCGEAVNSLEERGGQRRHGVPGEASCRACHFWPNLDDFPDDEQPASF